MGGSTVNPYQTIYVTEEVWPDMPHSVLVCKMAM